MNDEYADVRFPVKGVDKLRGFGAQIPGTTPEAVNVVGFEPSADRLRGGSRPGLVPYIGQVPSGAHLVQDLNFVVILKAEALTGSIDPPPFDIITGLPPVEDPSSPGPLDSWGRRRLDTDPLTGDPITGGTLRTRAPGSSGVFHPDGRIGGGVFGDGSLPSSNGPRRRRTRKGGSAAQPSPNVLTRADDPGVAPSYCFAGFVQIRIRMNPPDPFGWNGVQPAFNGRECRFFRPPTIPAPTSALTFASIQTQLQAFLAGVGRGNGPENDGYDIITDTVFPPGAPCPPTQIGRSCTG